MLHLINLDRVLSRTNLNLFIIIKNNIEKDEEQFKQHVNI